MKFKSQVYTQTSGSIGGITYSHNQGGMYTRGRASPKKYLEGPQAAARTRFTDGCNFWNSLSDANRTLWETYAQNTTWKNALGAEIKLSGRQHFLRSWCFRENAELASYRVSVGPSTFGLPGTGTLTVSLSAGTGQITVAYDALQDWCILTGGALVLFMSDQQESVVNVLKDYHYKGRVLGNTGAPPASPWTWPPPGIGTPVVGKRYFWRLVATTADGRVSADVIGFCTVGA